MNDLISRADVEQTIEDNILCYTHSDRPIDQDPDTECHMAIRTAFRMLRKDLRKLPSIQPEINCSEVPNTSDFVSRKAVQDMVATWSYDMAEWEDVELALMDKLLSVHPEVIHCKDCDLWHRTGCPMDVFMEKPEPGYFCGTAKRKESQCGYERQDVQTEENMQMIDLREEQEERLGAAPILNPKAK